MHSIRRFNLLCVALMWVFAFVFHASLPARIVTHFDINGQPHTWGENSLTFWLALTIPATLLTLLLSFVASIAGTNPQLVNVPQKEKLLKLPHERQIIVMHVVRQMLDWLTLMCTLTFLCVEISMFVSARTLSAPIILVLPFVLIPTLGIFVVIAVFLGKINAEIRRQSS